MLPGLLDQPMTIVRVQGKSDILVKKEKKK